MHQLTVFLSSTIDDLGDVRDEIDAALQRFGIQVWRSDRYSFPVKAGLSSHEACLEAVRHSDVLVTLIATRYGGSSSPDGKSITWSEYDAAVAAAVYPIVLIRKDANDLARKIHDRRVELRKKHQTLTESQLDAKVQNSFPDVKPYVDNLPAQQRFIDAVRKGHVDNWVHMEWTGTTDDALQYIMSKLASLLVSIKAEAEESNDLNDALQRLLEWVVILQEDVLAGRRTQTQAAERILELCEQYRQPLFGFRANDRFNFMLFVRDGDILAPEMRRTDKAIAVKNRTWKIGEGHAGRAIMEPRPVVTAYLPDSAMWSKAGDAAQDALDRVNYASAVSVPLRNAAGNADRVFIVTSSRRDHFHSDTQAEALTCATVGRILGILSRAGTT